MMTAAMLIKGVFCCGNPESVIRFPTYTPVQLTLVKVHLQVILSNKFFNTPLDTAEKGFLQSGAAEPSREST